MADDHIFGEKDVEYAYKDKPQKDVGRHVHEHGFNRQKNSHS